MMDLTGSRDNGFKVDLELGVPTSDEELNTTTTTTTPVSGSKRQPKTLIAKFCGGFVDGLKTEDGDGVSLESVKVTDKMLDGEETTEKTSSVKEKRKKSGNYKPSKPPRPPRGPSLDAADQKLIREISELAMLKRARVERMKALKKMKASKASSSSSNLFAMVFTILFFLVILFHGISSRSSTESLRGPSVSAGATEGGGLISVQFYPIPSASIPNGSGSESPNMVEQVAGAEPQEKPRRYAG